MSQYERKLHAAMKELEQSGMWRSNYAPPAFRIQRRLGQQARPPHYAPFSRTAVGYAFWFAGIWGILMWFTQWRDQGYTVASAAAASVFAGLIFGALIAGYYAVSRRKHGLSRFC